MLNSADADEFADKLTSATQRTVRDYELEDVVGEESFSEQLCGRLKETLEGFETRTIRWQVDVAVEGEGRGRLKARSLTKWKEEPDLGADLVMILDVTTPAFSIKKGFLAQAKRLRAGETLEKSKHKILLEQCDKMLSVTPSSMVFLYNESDVHVIPAAAIVQHSIRSLYEIITYDISILYRDFAICWFGDPRIQASDRLALEGLREQLSAHAAVRLGGKSSKSEDEADWSIYPDESR